MLKNKARQDCSVDELFKNAAHFEVEFVLPKKFNFYLLKRKKALNMMPIFYHKQHREEIAATLAKPISKISFGMSKSILAGFLPLYGGGFFEEACLNISKNLTELLDIKMLHGNYNSQSKLRHNSKGQNRSYWAY